MSNSGEAIIIKSEITKGILLRGYEKEDFSNLKIFGENFNLSKNLVKDKFNWKVFFDKIKHIYD